MAKGIRHNKVKTASQKRFNRLKRVQNKQKKKLSSAKKKQMVDGISQSSTENKKTLSSRQKRILVRELRRVEKDKTRMEVSTENNTTSKLKPSKSKPKSDSMEVES